MVADCQHNLAGVETTLKGLQSFMEDFSKGFCQDQIQDFAVTLKGLEDFFKKQSEEVREKFSQVQNHLQKAENHHKHDI